jgi:predicted glycoside hydrolase/deacetylase ChbG (UPF0249 family)
MRYRRFFYYSLVGSLIAVLSTAALVSIGAEAQNKVSSGEIKLIIRGDDMGFCHTVNLACLKAYKEGILRTVEIMVPPPWFNEAAKMLRENPGLDVGVHLTLTSEWDHYKWKPVLPVTEVPSLVDKDGYFFSRTMANPVYDKFYSSPYSFLEAKPKLSEVEKELRAQIEIAISKIPNITHLSCHMGTAIATAELKSLVRKLAREYKLPLIGDTAVKSAGSLFRIAPEQKEKALAKILENLSGGLWEVGCHPGLDTPEMMAIKTAPGDPNIRMAVHRNAVTNALTSKTVKEIIKKRNIKLISYGHLRKAK